MRTETKEEQMFKGKWQEEKNGGNERMEMENDRNYQIK